MTIDIDAYWEYDDPALSEERFRAALPHAGGDERLELLTQIARTYSLRGYVEQAHALLDEVEQQLAGAHARARIRYALERGRTHNSGGQAQRARGCFADAWQQALAHDEQGLAVDAAHMLAIAHAGTADALSWNRRGLEVARRSSAPKARALIPAMLNNSAWDLHELGRYGEALALFEEALREWTLRNQPQQIQVARWSVARCLRSLGRFGEALAIQQALAAEHRLAGTSDGYVYEELAENLAALGHSDMARPYFRQAADTLAADAWFREHEAARLAGLRARAGDE